MHSHYLDSFTPDAISRLDRDASTALAAIREWKNSFVPINRIPLDILSLIPTYLSFHGDRFRASFVCRHWRKTFLQRGAIWSELFTRKGETYITTLLRRAKGSGLDVTVNDGARLSTITLLPLHQIRRLDFTYSYWEDILSFSEIASGPFLLLRTLKVANIETHVQLSALNPPISSPFFRGAANLDHFILSGSPQLLDHFAFPNLTTFELLTYSVKGSGASNLLNFLEASPALRRVELKATGGIVLEDTPRETVVVLPNVETFSLRVRDRTATQAYDMAAYISCPCAKYTSLIHEMDEEVVTPDLEIFPVPASWSRILRQYTRSPAEEVVLELEFSEDPFSLMCSLTFRSPDATVIRLCLETFNSVADEDELFMRFEEIACEAFSGAHTIIQKHPLLSHIKRLRVKYRSIIENSDLIPRMATEIGRLFCSIGPLDELTIYNCDPHIYLGSIAPPKYNLWQRQIVFPHIKELTISHPLMYYDYDEGGFLNTIVELAKTHHSLGIPFERVTVRAETIFEGVEERLKQWVGIANCYEEEYVEIQNTW